jgi:uncharacterized delta-60 repeat protein
MRLAVALQTDGKIIVAGSSRNIPGETFSRFVLARYNDDGSLDATFGIEGRMSTEFARAECYAQAVVVQPDSKILVAGTTLEYTLANYRWDFALARYNSDGSLDLGYGIEAKSPQISPAGTTRHMRWLSRLMGKSWRQEQATTKLHPSVEALRLLDITPMAHRLGLRHRRSSPTDPDGDMTTAYAVAPSPMKRLFAGAVLTLSPA